MSVNESFGKLVLKNRSYRRFDESVKLDENLLRELVSLARLTPSAANLQPLRYRLVFNEDEKEKLFLNIFWAAYLKDWNGPVKGERPGGYIVVLKESDSMGSHWMFDTGISAQTILLGASDIGLGGCMIASLRGEEIKKDLNIDDNYEPVLVIALGKPVEKVMIDDMKRGGDVKYHRDEDKIHHVPKRRLEDLLI